MKILNASFTKIVLLAVLFAAAFSSSCKKGDPGRPPLRANLPIIDSISPKSGPYGTVVTIYGKNLGNDSTKITVNGKKASNTTPSDTRFVITVADSSSTGPVVVKNSYGQTIGPVFNYIPTTSYIVSTFAGNGTAGLKNGNDTMAQFNNPSGIAIDASGNLYVSDGKNHCIRKITSAGVVSTVAGIGVAGYADNPNPLLAQFNGPVGIAIDSKGNLFVTDQNNHCIREITSAGVTTFAGTPGTPGSTNGAALASKFNLPASIALDAAGNCYVGEVGAPKIRLINTSLQVSTLAGTGSYGAGDGVLGIAQFAAPRGLVLDPNNTYLYVGDYTTNKIRRVTVSTGATDSPIGNGVAGFEDGLALNALLGAVGMARDASGNLYFTDYDNNRIRKVLINQPINQSVVSTLAGIGSAAFSNGPGNKASFRNPYALVLDGQGDIYVSDLGNNRIRKLTPYQH